MNSSAIELYEILRRRIMTTMIGSIAIIEQFKELFEDKEWEEIRTKILNNGNKEIERLERDLDQFNIKTKMTYFMPLRRRNG